MPLAAVGVASQVLASQAGLARAGLPGLAVAAIVAWRPRFRLSEQARTWQPAPKESATPRLLRLRKGVHAARRYS